MNNLEQIEKELEWEDLLSRASNRKKERWKMPLWLKILLGIPAFILAVFIAKVVIVLIFVLLL